MTSAGAPDWLARAVADLYSLGGAAEVTDVVAKVGKKKPIRFDEFAANFAPAFESTARAR